MKKTALYGAILGDIVGVPYEFDRRMVDDINFPLFCDESNFSDDTVTTIAIADAILKSGKSDEETFQNELINSLQIWCRRYPKSGYGGRFHDWINSDNPKPYNSYGNGAAMRVSAVGWFYDTIFDTREAARKTAYITHNHPEGIKGAMAAASAIFLARNGRSKSEIKNYIASEFEYDLDRTIEEIRPNCTHTEKIWKTVPEAIIAFLESEDFEGALRNVVWLGGDTDTLGAIAGSIAEAFYGIPKSLIEECRSRIPQEMLDVIDRFNSEIFTHKSEIPTISPERMARFTYSAEEIESLKFYPSTEAWVEECKKKGLKVHLYGSESAD